MSELRIDDTTSSPCEDVMISIAAPVYNEEACIEGVVREWEAILSRLGISSEIVLCNDGSTDATASILERLQTELPCLRVVGGKVNRGYGHALATAIQACRGRYIITIDSDGQFDLADLDAFWKALSNSSPDGIVGYRIRKQDSWLRVFADRALHLMVRLLFGTRLRDTNCALKMIRRECLQALRLEATGYPFPTEIALKLEASGAKLVELPVRHREREAGESKLKVWRTGWRMFFFLLYLRLRFALFRARIIQEL